MLRIKPKIYFVLIAVVLFCRFNCRAQQSSASSGPAGTISGRVINSAGEPLSGAAVSASSLRGGRSQTATANNAGEFKIDGLEPGLYRVFPVLTGYVSSSQPSGGESTYYRIGDSVTLTMMKGAVITGTVTGPNGPLVGVGVFVSRVRDEEGKKIPSTFALRERSTDDRGIFRIYGLQPGSYIVWAAKPRIGLVAPTAYDNDTPTYFPAATRDTASEIIVRDGDEATADIQYRAEPGHAVSGKVAGVIDPQVGFSSGASVSLTEVQTRNVLTGISTNATDNHGFAIYGIPNGEYELAAFQYLPTGDLLKSSPQQVTVRGADVTGLSLTLVMQGSIEGRLVFESDAKNSCAKRKATAIQETLVKAWRYLDKNEADAKSDSSPASSVAANYQVVANAKGSFILRNMSAGTYKIDSPPPASGWYLKSIAIGTTAAARTSSLSTARDGITLRGSEHITGLMVTMSEGASHLRGRISVAEGQSLPPRLVIYLVPAEREAADNVLRFYEANPEADRTFTFDNINPGRYFVIARPVSEKDADIVKPLRRDSSLRTALSREAAAAKKEVSFKPCERIADYELPYSP